MRFILFVFVLSCTFVCADPDPPLPPGSSQQYDWTTSCEGYTVSSIDNACVDAYRACTRPGDSGSALMCTCNQLGFTSTSTSARLSCNSMGTCSDSSHYAMLGSPLNAWTTGNAWPVCVCDTGTGAFCEIQPAPNDYSYNSWKWALPALPASQDGVTIVHRDTMASLEYGFHVLGRTLSYLDYVAKDSPSQLPIDGTAFLRGFMNRAFTQFLPAPVDPLHEVNILSAGYDQHAPGCPPGMQKYSISGKTAQLDNPSEYFCGCIPGDRTGCSSNGDCQILYPTHDSSTKIDQNDHNNFNTLSNWCVDNTTTNTQDGSHPSKLECTVLFGGSLAVGNAYSMVRYFMAVPWSWQSNVEYSMCMCENFYSGFYCEIDIADQVQCNGHGHWDRASKTCTCDINNGWLLDNLGGCSTPDLNYWYCNNRNGIWDPVLQACHCTDTGYWGLHCDQPCDELHCNGRGSCVMNSVLNDGLSFPAIQDSQGHQPDRVSHKCACYDDGVVAAKGPHCTVVSRKNITCDGFGSEAPAGLLTDGVFSQPGVTFLDDLICTANPANTTTGVVYEFIQSTGRTIAHCPLWLTSDALDTAMQFNQVSVYLTNEIVTLSQTTTANSQECGGPQVRGSCQYALDTNPFAPSTVGTCLCFEGFYGSACEHARCVIINGALCSGNGICDYDNNRCICLQGYMGYGCELYDEGSCQNNAQYIGST